MDAHTASEVEEWPEVPFSGGTDGLHDLANREFTGAVRNAGATLYMLNGRVVGVEDGSIETFTSEGSGGTGGTAREAPHDALPLLYAMQLRDEQGDGEVRGSYYSEETPIEEVDRTLKQGGFTGYLELSENVLSGDYYMLYQGGRAAYVALIGNARRVITDEEAFERACGEVGIYEVTAVDLEVIEIPGEPDGSGTTESHTATGPTPDADADTGTAAADADAAAARDSSEPSAAEDEPADDDPATIGSTDELDDLLVGDTGSGAGTDDVPDELAAEGASEGGADEVSQAGEAGGVDEPEPRSEREALKAELVERENELQRVRQELSATREERDRLSSTVDQLQARVEELEREAGDGTGAEAGTAAVEGGAPDLSVSEALDGTSLFVRYASKGRPTLADLHDDQASLDEVRDNLRIEYHTRFENDGATVDGRGFEAWLHDRPEYRFMGWLTTVLPFEIRATNAVSSMSKLHDAIPDLDRVALDTSIQVDTAEGQDPDPDDGTGGSGERTDRSVTFDLVAYNQMGQPLVVADMETSREPVMEEAMADLVREATVIANTDSHLTGAFFVTESYFEPPALSIAGNATGGSLLSRDKRKSYVKLSRSRGFHLCLVENREGSFHLTVPEL